jgi:hypothetical protein
MRLRSLFILAVSLGLFPATKASLHAQEMVFGGELRPRFELRHPVFRDWTDRETRDFVSMRTRGSMLVSLPAQVRAFIQLQDVREWGADPNTMAVAAPGLDLHQAWIELGDELEAALSARIGRQELIYGEERLVGAVNWAQQGRSFNGVRLRVRPHPGAAVDGLVMPIGDEDVGAPGSSAGLYGLYGFFDFLGRLDAYVLYNHADHLAGMPPATQSFTDQYTVGGRWASAAHGFNWRVEAALQRGTRAERDVVAHLVALQAGTALGARAGIDLWYDLLSGGAPGDTIRVFDTLFATNHKFYGFMDLFTNIPVHTAGRGLQDLAVKARYQLLDNLSLALDAHTFRFASTAGLDSGRLGEELDLEMRWGYARGVSLWGGAAYFVPGAAWTDVLGHPDRNLFWTYLMLGVNF